VALAWSGKATFFEIFDSNVAVVGAVLPSSLGGGSPGFFCSDVDWFRNRSINQEPAGPGGESDL